MNGTTGVTQVLSQIEAGDPLAAEQLLPLVYQELRKLANLKMTREQPGQTLQATALVHEAYIRLLGSANQHWDSRGHFFAAAAEAMRRILVENARRKRRIKRGGQHRRLDVDQADLAIEPLSDDVLALHDALDQLATKDKIKAELVKLRYFAGLTVPQAAKILGVSTATAERYWAYARAWLHQEMIRGNQEASTG